MTDRLQKSKEFTEEYCCSVVRVGELTAVENSDNLMRTTVNGESIVVNKKDVKEGDIMLYVSNECQISDWFLSRNNLYRHWALNSNHEEVEARVKENPDFEKSDEMKGLCGYFDDNGRVRMIRLRGCPSFGVLFKTSTMSMLPALDWEAEVGTDFDTIDGQLLVKAYVPKRNYPRQHHERIKVSRWDRFDRMVPGQFKLHYDTSPLKKHLASFRPDTSINVTIKMHGTSFICGNLLTNVPLHFFKLRRIINRILHTSIPEMRKEYGMVVSSRKVIKNEWANSEHPEGYYGTDIWTEYGELLFPYIPKGYTVYGEICGYLTGDSRMVQNGYDYGCKAGENFLMPYRVTKHEEGRLVELSVDEVGRFTEQMKTSMQDAGDTNALGRIHNILNVQVYSGRIADMMDTNDMEHLPTALATLGKIEDNEPLCKTKVPREGVVVRINGDEIAEAFKLKSLRFMEREKAAIDKGEVDIEMENNL